MTKPKPTLLCQTEDRRHEVRKYEATLNGLDFLEVLQHSMAEDHRQPELVVYFLNKVSEAHRAAITKANVRVEGGRRAPTIKVTGVQVCHTSDDCDDCMHVWLADCGDFSTYTLYLVEVDANDRPVIDVDEAGHPRYRPLAGIDPRYAALEFNFRAGERSDLDCKPRTLCPPPVREEPVINYLAKDYASFRQIILDRLALIMPDWQERHAPDLGITLVELLAYAGDQLSYYQDAVATEAYLQTARQRISVRRHARLVDYAMHEGCNARAWLFVEVESDFMLPPDCFFVTGYNDALRFHQAVLSQEELAGAAANQYEVFEQVPLTSCLFSLSLDFVSQLDAEQLSPGLRKRFEEKGYILAPEAHLKTDQPGKKWAVSDLSTRYEIRKEVEMLNVYLAPGTLYSAHNEIEFYTWGDRECCLPRGATRATLKDGSASEVRRVKPKAEAEQSTVSQTPAVKNARTTWEYHRVLDLKMGDVLVFEEAIGPNTGQAADADPRHRHVVRLTGVKEAVDELYHQPVLEIAWAAEDALPFPLCLSVVGPVSTGCQLIENVSVARGNIVLVDHGRWTADDDPDEKLWTVPARCITQTCQGIGDPAVIVAEPARFRPVLQKGPLTFSQPLLASSSAAAIMEQDPRQALPCLELKSIPPAPLAAPDPQRVVPLFRPHDLKDPTNLAKRLRAPQAEGVVSIYLRSLLSAATQTALDQYDGADTLPADLHNGLITDLGGLLREWTARADLLASQADDPHYVTELDNRERAHLRFGDGELGFQPEAGTAFVARYRVGNGLAGNVGADAICHLVFRQTTVSGGVLAVRNPLPAQGGRAAETLAEVKRFAPYAFRSDLQRAISPDDCTQLVLRQFGSQVQRARVTLRWTGSWYEMLVAIDQLGQVEADEGLLADIARYLERYRRIGYDLVVKAARYVPLEIKLKVCVKPAYLRGHVMAVLLDLFSNRRLPDGRLGFFHPDNLTFGQGIRLSSLVALAQSAPGVTSVEVAKLQRYDAQPSGEIAQGILPLGPFEIARLDNDAAFPEHGLFELEMEGGR